MKIFIVCLVILLCAGCFNLKPQIPVVPHGGVAASGTPSLIVQLWNMLGLFLVLQILITVVIVHHFDLVMGLISMAVIILLSYAGIKYLELHYNIIDIAATNLIAFYIIWTSYDKYLVKVLKA